MKVWAFKLIY